MKRFYLLFFVVALLGDVPSQAQSVTTLYEGASCMNDALAMDSAGNLYGSRYNGGAVYKYNVTDGVSLFAGQNIGAPNGLAVSDDDVLYIADNTAHRIYRKGTQPGADMELFVDSLMGVSGLIFQPGTDTLIASSYTQSRLYKITPEGDVLAFNNYPAFSGPAGMGFDTQGNLFVANFNNRAIFKVDPAGNTEFFSQLPGSGNLGFMCMIGDTVYATAVQGFKIYKITPDRNVELFLGSSRGDEDGDPSTARFTGPNGIFPAPGGDSLYVSEFIGYFVNGTGRLRLITNLSGQVSTATKAPPAEDIQIRLNPNPARDWAQLSFKLSESSRVKATLLDQYGKEVHVILPDTTLAAGTQEQRFTVANLRAGLYYCTMEIEGRFGYVERIMIVD